MVADSIDGGLVEVTLDVTGFYFDEKVRVAPDSSVKDVMQAVVEKTAGTGREFRFHSAGKGDSEGGGKGFSEFLSEISVKFDDTNPPKSRQKHRDGHTLKSGTYLYKDDYRAAEYGDSAKKAPFSLVWQYYITDAENRLLSGVNKDGIRIKVPFTRSNTLYEGEGPINFKGGERITWRLVAIFLGPTGNPEEYAANVKSAA